MPLITVAFGEPNTGASVFYRVLNADGTVSQARTATGVSELVAGSGVYGVNVADSVIAGKTVVWDINSTTKVASETFPQITSASFVANAIDANAFGQAAADKAWSTATRVLTAGTNIAFPTVPSATDNAAAVWSVAIEGSRTAAGVLRLVYSSVANKLSGAATGTVRTRNEADTKDRLVVTVDTDGNRTAVVRDDT